MQHDRTKHVEVVRYFIKDHLQSRNICTPFVNTDYQLANILTKGLSSDHFFVHYYQAGNMELLFSNLRKSIGVHICSSIHV